MANRRFCFRVPCVLLFVVCALTQSAFAKPRDMSLYPMRLHIFESEWKPSSVGGSGNGTANLFDGADIHGVTFSYFCPVNYMKSFGNQAYAARWKKPGKKIEIVSNPIGKEDKSDTCEFNVTLHDFVYDVQNGTLTTFTLEQYKVRVGMALPKDAAVDSDPSHYTFRLSVLEVTWTTPVNGARSGSGRGNLRSSSGVSSVDFNTECNAAFQVSGDNRYYAGRWTQEGSTLVLLLTAKGTAMSCTLKTSVHTDVYVKDANGSLKAISVDEYRRTVLKQSAPATPSSPGTGQTTPSN